MRHTAFVAVSVSGHKNPRFFDGALDHALRYLAPHERRDYLRLATEAHADDRSQEPTVTLAVRVPISLAIRFDIERANIKRALRQRRATRSDTVRFLLEQQLAELDREATGAPAQQPTAAAPEARAIAA